MPLLRLCTAVKTTPAPAGLKRSFGEHRLKLLRMRMPARKFTSTRSLIRTNKTRFLVQVTWTETKRDIFLVRSVQHACPRFPQALISSFPKILSNEESHRG